MTSLPTLFISHGAPDTAIAETPAAEFLKGFGATLPRPKAIVVVSAHFETDHDGGEGVGVSGDARPEMIYDFGGFDRRLYDVIYPAPGEPDLAARIASELATAGFPASIVTDRGYDHGTWVPLVLMYPAADTPVVQVSVDRDAGPEHHFRLGRALAKLREEDVLVIGSGSFTHNLGEAFAALRKGERRASLPEWVESFITWMDERLAAGDETALLSYRSKAPNAVRNHPSDEHLMPLYVALGAAGPGWRADKVHRSHEFGALSMDAFAFH